MTFKYAQSSYKIYATVHLFYTYILREYDISQCYFYGKSNTETFTKVAFCTHDIFLP
jgi:hypothetical protein